MNKRHPNLVFLPDTNVYNILVAIFPKQLFALLSITSEIVFPVSSVCSSVAQPVSSVAASPVSMEVYAASGYPDSAWSVPVCLDSWNIGYWC